MPNGALDWADEWMQSMSCDLCRQRPSKKPTYEKGDLFSSWLRDNTGDGKPSSAQAPGGMKQSPPPRDAKEEPVVAVVMHAFTAVDPRPFPPDVYGDMSILPGQSLFVYPGRTTSGWCFAESTRNGAEKGWVPGNYISRDGVNPFIELDDVAWKEVDPNQLQSQAANGLATNGLDSTATSQAAQPQAAQPQLQTLQARPQAGSLSQTPGEAPRGFAPQAANLAPQAAAPTAEYGAPPGIFSAMARQASDESASSVNNPPIVGGGGRRSTYMEALI